MTGVIDWSWTTSASISQSIGMACTRDGRWRLAARLARKPRRCNMPLATAAVKAQLPSTPTNKNKIRGGARRPVPCGNHQSRNFYFPPPRDTSKKNRGKGQEKGTASWTDPATAAGTDPREEESHTARQPPALSPPPPLLPSASHLLIHGPCFGWPD
jgi:hypothetical protein